MRDYYVKAILDIRRGQWVERAVAKGGLLREGKIRARDPRHAMDKARQRWCPDLRPNESIHFRMVRPI